MVRQISLLASVFIALALASCGGGPANVAGEYTVALTNRENGCAFDNWVEGQTATGIPVTITQSGSNVSAEVKGGAGVFLGLWLGAAIYQGTVSIDTLSLTLYGKISKTTGNCTYTINSTFGSTLNGDVMTGEIHYTSATNGNPDCSSIQGCTSRQEFNAIRPPS